MIPNLENIRAALAGGPAVVPAGISVPEWAKNTALAITTSGSTNAPKVVLLSDTALLASAEGTHERLGGPGTWLLALPTTHIAGAQVLVRSVIAGTQPGTLNLASGFRATGFVSAAQSVLNTPGRHYTALVPTQLGRLIAAGPGLATLREFDAVLVGGAATPAWLLERAQQLGVQVVTTYGMTETAGGCVYDGVPLRQARIRIMDGRIEVAGPMLALGYVDGDRIGTWFSTNDLGQLKADGRLEVLGRADDIIISGGEKVIPAVVEHALTAHPAVVESCVVGVPDPEWGHIVGAAVVPQDLQQKPDIETLRKVVFAAVGRAGVPKRFLFMSALPLHSHGKVDRVAVKRAFE
jgi:O-succinylbenzoic acid--CoA ligase